MYFPTTNPTQYELTIFFSAIWKSFKRKEETPQIFDVKFDINSVFNETSRSFSVFTRPNVTLLISPESTCNKKHVVIVPSAPKNRNLRNILRKQLRKKASLYFLLGNSKGYDEMILEESKIEKDIIKADIPDSYRILPYKIIVGFIWTNRLLLAGRRISEKQACILVRLQNVGLCHHKNHFNESEHVCSQNVLANTGI